MQTDEHSQFTITPQVAAILAITLLALAVPLAGVAFMVKGLFMPPQKTPEEIIAVENATVPLQRTLENIAGHTLGASELSGGDRKVTLAAKDVAAERARVAALARDFGATALPAEAGVEARKSRLLVQLPAGQVDLFVSACEKRETGKPDSSVTSVNNNDPRVLVEVVIQGLTP